MNVFLTSLGCRLNEAELQIWAKDFYQNGIAIVKEQSDANLIVINTCAVTGEAARKSRQTIRRFHRKNPTAKIVVTGCYASIEKTEAESLLGVDLIVSNQDKNLLPQKAKELLEWQSMPYAATEPEESALFVRNRERAFIKIQDGCRYRCTYCIVTIARGEEVSRSIADIILEIKQLYQQGVQEIVITGVHVGGYGSDLDTNLYELVVAVLEQTNIPRIRFASVEPWELSDAFFELFNDPRLMPHMHLPIQSGSDKILKKCQDVVSLKRFYYF
jgi:threonylcarbamoyladenosine tRNA methylthiotransferase MtaB